MAKKLQLSQNKVILGVCGGVAEYFGIDATLMRVIWVIFCLLGGAGVLLYLIIFVVLKMSESK